MKRLDENLTQYVRRLSREVKEEKERLFEEEVRLWNEYKRRFPH